MHARRAAIVSLALLLLWPAAPASAKFFHVRSVSACGPTGCAPLSAAMMSHVLGSLERRGVVGDEQLGPYYRLHIRPGYSPMFLFYLPSTRTIDLNGQAYRVTPRIAARIRAQLGVHQPYPPRVSSVWVGTHRAAHPQRYVPLLFARPVSAPASVWNHRDVLVGIDLAGETPWSGWGAAEYFPVDRLLHVPDGVWVRVSDAQAAMIARDLHPGRRSDTGGGAPVMAAGAAAAGLVAVGLLALAVRRRREGA
jgi:hypothetical protein